MRDVAIVGIGTTKFKSRWLDKTYYELAFDAAKIRQARDVGEQIVSLVKADRPLNHYLNEISLENGSRRLDPAAAPAF